MMVCPENTSVHQLPFFFHNNDKIIYTCYIPLGVRLLPSLLPSRLAPSLSRFLLSRDDETPERPLFRRVAEADGEKGERDLYNSSPYQYLVR